MATEATPDRFRGRKTNEGIVALRDLESILGYPRAM